MKSVITGSGIGIPKNVVRNDALTKIMDTTDEWIRTRSGIEQRIALYRHVEQLPDLQRQMIRMRFIDEKSIREVAAALRRSEGAVKQLQLRALENLRKRMGGNG